MGMAARKHNNNHHDGCSSCHSSDCHGGCETVISREIIHDHGPHFCVKVCGDYTADHDDSVIIVFGDGDNVDVAGNQLPSNVDLPCPDDVDECNVVTVIAVDAPVIVGGLQNEEIPDAMGVNGTGTVRLEIGQEAKFRAIHPLNKCDCAYYLACVC